MTTISGALSWPVLMAIFLIPAGVVSAQDRVCSDGQKSYFDVCPNDKPAPSILQQRLEDWSSFPKNTGVVVVPDILEQDLVNKDPQTLYEILKGVDRASLELVPNLGEDLYAYKFQYYKFRQSEVDFEQSVSSLVGTKTPVRYRQAWDIFLNYYILRASGNTRAQVEAMGNFLNFGLTFDDCEKMYLELAADPNVSRLFAANTAEYARLSGSSKALAIKLSPKGS